MKLQYNEKPSSINNIGEDINGSRRHNFNTYTDEQKEERDKIKSNKKMKDTLKELARQNLANSELTQEQCFFIISKYEFDSICLKLNVTCSDDNNLKQWVLNNRTRDNVKSFNKYTRLKRKLSYTRLNELHAYFDTKKKETYNHVTGVDRAWKTSESLNGNAIDFLKAQVKAVQFGNTLSENERIFCLNELQKGIEQLKILLPTIDFTKIGFSFGARGKAGTVAHYEDSNKVIAINRNRCGSIIHEIGHAIDSQKGELWKHLPAALVDAYRTKVYSDPILKNNAKYLLNKKEIFARAFESFMSLKVHNLYLLDGDRSDWPELTESDVLWMSELLS